jgi:hypothetical protein
MAMVNQRKLLVYFILSLVLIFAAYILGKRAGEAACSVAGAVTYNNTAKYS